MTAAANAARTFVLALQMATAVVIVALYWVLSAAIAATFSEGASFTDTLLSPSPHELIDLFIVTAIAGSFIRYYRSTCEARGTLEVALQEALMKAEGEREKVTAVIEAMGDAISVQDLELNVLFQNRTHQELVGAHQGELCFRAYRNSETPCDGCHLLMAFEDGAVHRVEQYNSDSNRWFEIMGSALKDQAGRVTAGIEVVRDITDRKEAEQTARKEAALLQHLIDTIPNPIYYQDPSGRFVWCNTAFAGWLAKPRDLIVGRTLAEVAPEPVVRELSRREPGLVRAETVHELSLTRGDQEVRDVIFYKSMFTEAAGKSGGAVGVIVDITDRKRAEAEIVALNAALTQQALELQQANRELEAFTHSISHDLRTPLTTIYSSGQALLEYGGSLDENGLYFVKAVNDGCLQLEALLDALLILARVTEVDLQTDVVDLSQVALEKAALMRKMARGREVSVRIAPGLRARGDLQLLHIVLENLIANAWKYTTRTPEAVVEFGSLVSGEGETVFFVRDNGAGFDPSRAEQLFKPFRRLHSPSDFPGTGLGLATVRRIIRRHGGRVWGEGSPGQGATFYFTLNT